MASALSHLSDWTDRFTRWLLVPMAALFVAVVFLAVLTRYVFRAPIITSIELARIGFVWCAFLGAVVCLKREKHTQFLFLLDRFRGRTRLWLDTWIAALSLGFFAVVTFKGVQMVQAVQDTYFPALGWSQVWLYLPVPVCCACMLVHTTALLARDVQALVRAGERGGRS
jgi:TRAP-type C4-dicarboxylate transport system permease small subunit